MARTCSRCVLPEFEPDIRLDERGVCNVCRAHGERIASSREEPPLETDFVKLLERYRGKRRHDCLVMCSGGKDSTASLYLMKRRYRMSPLAFTFDLGYECEEALANVRNAVEALEVDLVHYRTHYLAGLFRRILESDSQVVLCHVCSIHYMGLAFETARRYRTPLIIAGWTKGQFVRKDAAASGRYVRGAPEYAAMARATREFVAGLRGDPVYGDFPASMEEAVARAGGRPRPNVQSPHWYLPDATEEYEETLRDELGWRPIGSSYPRGSTNCRLNFLSVARSLERYGYTHYHVEMSKLIRQGLMTREEALERLEPDFDPALLRDIEQRCGVSPDRP